MANDSLQDDTAMQNQPQMDPDELKDSLAEEENDTY